MDEIKVNERDLDLLDDEFKAKLSEVLDRCLENGIKMKPYCLVRSPWTQARLWRKSRSGPIIRDMLSRLLNAKQPFLYDCLNSVGPQRGRLGKHVTWVTPGYSWHQHGQAADCYWDVNGTAVWSTTDTVPVNGQRVNGYKVYADIAQEVGLYSGGIKWKNDWPHIHMSGYGSPRPVFDPAELDRLMSERFSN